MGRRGVPRRMTTYFEDVAVGDTFEHGDYEVTREEILTFAEQYDPQWYHTDPERAAEESPYGGLIASGWHTASVTMRLLVDGVLDDAAVVGAKGVDELRWRVPVRPGDVLRIEVEVEEAIPERPERGVVRPRIETYNGDGDCVFSMVGNVMYRRRDAA